MSQVLGDSSNIYGGTSGALQTDFPTSVGNVLIDLPKGAEIMEGDFVPGSAKTTLKPVEATTSSRSRRSVIRRTW